MYMHVYLGMIHLCLWYFSRFIYTITFSFSKEWIFYWLYFILTYTSDILCNVLHGLSYTCLTESFHGHNKRCIIPFQSSCLLPGIHDNKGFIFAFGLWQRHHHKHVNSEQSVQLQLMRAKLHYLHLTTRVTSDAAHSRQHSNPTLTKPRAQGLL